MFEDIDNDASYRKSNEYKIGHKQRFRSAFYVPVWAQGKIMGVISFLCKKPHCFSANEIQLIDTIASHLGTAVRNAQLYEAVVQSRNELKKLTSSLQTAREKEYARLSRQVHDELGQPLVALKMAVANMMAELSQTSQPHPSSKGLSLNLIDGMIKTVRNISKGLHPAILDELDLAAALRWQTREFEERTGIHCKFKTIVGHLSMDKFSSICLFRVLQESLNNVQRHSQADQVEVEWKKAARGLSLRIHDNGKGITKGAFKKKDSFGIFAMRERVLDSGGDLKIFGSYAKGTTVIATLPYPRSSDASSDN